ncbi:MAG TPA: SIMPL domain-containing protein [Pirellulales bacterium]|nr:SIMPL domain-containing protein [Pirellulales bacterium]
MRGNGALGPDSRNATEGVPYRWAVVWACVLLLPTISFAQYAGDPSGGSQTGGISVYGTGETSAKPDLVEISLRANATAELTADALVKYKDTKRRTLEAFEKLKLEKLEVEEQGVSLANQGSAEQMQMAMRGMMGTGSGKSQVQISSSLHLRLSGIHDLSAEEVLETVGTLLDAAKDAGAEIGPTAAEVNMAWRYGNVPDETLVRFIINDLDKLREQAYENAVADARTRAERLAKLNGVKLGRVLGVQEMHVSADDARQVVYNPYGRPQHPSGKPRKPHIASETFNEIPFQVKLLVRFAIEPEADKTAKNE